MFFPGLFAICVRLFGKTSVCRKAQEDQSVYAFGTSCCCATPTIFRKRFLKWKVQSEKSSLPPTNPQPLTPDPCFLIFAFQIAGGVLNGVEKEA
jgi:hypothetical protein